LKAILNWLIIIFKYFLTGKTVLSLTVFVKQ